MQKYQNIEKIAIFTLKVVQMNMATQKGKNTSKNQPQGAKLSFKWKISTTEREFSHAKSNHFNGNPHDQKFCVKLNYFPHKICSVDQQKAVWFESEQCFIHCYAIDD